MSLPFHNARSVVLQEIGAAGVVAAVEEVALDDAAGRVLVSAVLADRDQPPFDRVTRDGFAVRSVDVAAAAGAPVSLAIIGEAPPGQVFAGQVGPGQCVEIMTGAPLPAGADAVVMVEYTERPVGGGTLVSIKRPVAARENVVGRGSEIRAGQPAFPGGRRLDPAAMALAASLGCARPRVVARPKVAIITTGDELVAVDQTPGIAQIRNSNLHSLAAQVVQAGGIPIALPIARDNLASLRALLAGAIDKADLLLLSGGVSMGKYDFVEKALSDLGARIVFDGVDIRPGRPLVFGFLRGKPFFGLPGNPLSTLVTFALFVRPALDLLGGIAPATVGLPCAHAQLGEDFSQRKVPLTVFLPAQLATAAGTLQAIVRPLPSQGSGDLVAMARADGLLVIEPGVTALAAGAWVPVWPK